MFKHGNKDEKKEVDKKDDKRKEKERLKSEKKHEKEDRKRSTTAATTDKPPKSAPKDIAAPERTLSSTSLPTNDFKPSSPVPVSPRSNSRYLPAEPLSLDKEPSGEVKTPALDVSSPRTTPPLTASASQSISSSPPVSPLLSSSLTKSSDTTKRVSNEGSYRSHSPAATKQPDNINLLKSKIGSLPPDTKQLVEYLLNIFGRALPEKWSAPPNLDVSIDDQVDVTLDKLVEASEILFNKDAPSLLKRYGKDLKESPNRRTDKWKSITNMLGAEDAQFTSLYLSSDILDAIVVSALSKPLEGDEVDILAEILKISVIHDINLKELLSVVQASSKSNSHVKNKVEENKSLSDAIVELVCSLRKLSRSPSDEFQVQDLKKDDVSESLSQSVALLEHANTIKHAKGGHDILNPLEKFFENQIVEEIQEGERWKHKEEEAQEEKAKKILDIDGFINEEEGKLKNVQENITDLEAKLEQKKAEEKRLQESLEQKLKEREQYIKEREKAEAELKAHIEESSQHLEHHKKAEESIVKFAEDIGNILNKEVNETLKRTKDVLQELDKEVTFLEEKMVTYERSISLFNAADEPEVLDGLKKLFTRSTAIYAESKQSVSRVTGVVELLRIVLGDDSDQVEDLANSLEKIVTRQTTLNNKYKLQKE